MTQQADGSRAMTIYIVVCFVLAAGALVAYKMMNDKRAELATDYRARWQNVVDIQGALAPSIGDYYRKVKNGEIKTVTKKVKDDTEKALNQVAEKLGISSTGEQDRLDIDPDNAKPNKSLRYVEYGCTVTLKNVSQSEWAAFLRNVLDPFNADNVLDEYVTVAGIDAVRVESNYRKMVASAESGGRYVDLSPWKVTIKFVWFATMEEADRA